MPICSSRECDLSVRKPFVVRKLIKVRGKIGMLLCCADHHGRIRQNDLKRLASIVLTADGRTKWPGSSIG
jgi:hypothetical protein